jgi:hypothetical protein
MRATSLQPGTVARKSNSIRVRPDGSVRISMTAMVNPSTRAPGGSVEPGQGGADCAPAKHQRGNPSRCHQDAGCLSLRLPEAAARLGLGAADADGGWLAHDGYSDFCSFVP